MGHALDSITVLHFYDFCIYVGREKNSEHVVMWNWRNFTFYCSTFILLSVCWELHKNRILSVFLIMCTIGSVGRVLAYSIGQYVNRHSVNPQSKVSRHISWLSVEYRVLLSISWLSVNDLYFEHQCIGQYRVNGISVTCRWYILVWCQHNLKYLSTNKQPLLWILM